MFIDRWTNQRAATPSPTSERPLRSLVKAISWRVTGSIDTIGSQ